MRITLERQNKAVHFRAVNEEGASIDIDGASSIGGRNLGLRPMQLLLAGIGSCSSLDIISILKKQKQDLEDLRIEVNGERESGKIPSLFTNINVHFVLKGELEEAKVKRAIDLSMNKYCSVSKIIEKTADISS